MATQRTAARAEARLALRCWQARRSPACASAEAATLVGLTADNKLVKIDTATMAASAPMAISGADKVVGIDVRPADGKLYGLTATGQLVVIDHMSGAATPGSMVSEKVALGPRPVVDFNPVADRLRVIAADGAACASMSTPAPRMIDKPLNYDAADASSGKKPAVAAGAYTNSMKGAKGTELFHVDGGTGALVLQNPPNDGVLKTRGMVGVTGAADVGDGHRQRRRRQEHRLPDRRQRALHGRSRERQGHAGRHRSRA